MASPRNFDPATTWSALYNVITAVLPLFTFAIVWSVVVYVVFVLFVPRVIRVGSRPIDISAVPDKNVSAANSPPPALPVAQTLSPDELGLGAMSGLSYLVVASVFGIIVGMLTNQIGGLEALLKEQTAESFEKGLASTLVLALAVVGGLFLDNSGVQQRRPLGALAFLVSFLVSGLYWPMIITI